jgi:hypothetical protein
MFLKKYRKMNAVEAREYCAVFVFSCLYLLCYNAVSVKMLYCSIINSILRKCGLGYTSTGTTVQCTYVSFLVATIVQDSDPTDKPSFWPPSSVIICTDQDSDPDPFIIKQKIKI